MYTPSDPARADRGRGAPALRLLGPPAWHGGDGRWHALSRKDAALLARLAWAGEQPRSSIAAWLWPEVPLSRAHANLRQRLFRLRRAGGALVEESATGLRLAPGVHCDVARDGCSEGADLAAPLLALAPEPGGDDAVQAWLDELQQQWPARRAQWLAARAEACEVRGDIAAALATTEQLLAAEPLLEHGWRRLMRLHSVRGDRAAALAAFERCERLLRDELGVRPSPETLALLQEVETLEPTPPPAAAPAWPAALLRPPRVVGRAAEQQALAAAWQAGRAFVLRGEAGQGKSRLLGELAAAGPGRVLLAARPGDEELPYGALVRLLRALQRAASPPDALWPAGPARAELARLLPELGPAPAAPGLEALLHDALEQVFAQAGRAGIAAVLFDDLQHADEATRTVLRRVAGAHGLQWGLSCRPRAVPGLDDWLASSARVVAVDLHGLQAAQVHELVATLQLPGLDLPTLVPALSRHCGGNPLFVLETLRHLMLQGPPADGAAPGLPLPASVGAVLAQRLARLSPPAQSLARVAAIAGTDFRAEVAADVLGLDLWALATPWTELEQAQVLRSGVGVGVDVGVRHGVAVVDDTDAVTPADEAHGFAHESLRDAVLAGLPDALRAPLHGRIAASLQRLDAPPQRVALHLAAAGDLGAAAPWALRAAALALRLGRTAERLAQLRQAAQWYAQAGDEAAAFEARVLSVAPCLAREGAPAAQALLQQLLAQAATHAQRVSVRLAQAQYGVAGYDAALAVQAATAALAETSAGSEAELQAQVLLAAGQARVGEAAADALGSVQALQPRLDALADAALAADLWGHCAVVFNANGRTADCMQALQRQADLARACGHRELEVAALTNLGSQLVTLGDAAAAVDNARQAVALQRRIGSNHDAVLGEVNLAIALIGLTELDEAQRVLLEVRVQLDRLGGARDVLHVVGELHAEIWLRLARPGLALQALDADDGAAATALPRRLCRLALRGQALRALGDEAGAQACWQALGGAVPAGGSTGLHLRARALASLALPHEAAVLALDGVLQAAQQTGFAAGQALARMLRVDRALALGDRVQALEDAHALQALRPRAQHLFACEARLRATVCRAYEACGLPAVARAAREDARRWAETWVLPRLPSGHERSWRTHPDHAGVYA